MRDRHGAGATSITGPSDPGRPGKEDTLLDRTAERYDGAAPFPDAEPRSFTAAPLLRVIPAIAGSMGFQGSVIGWVATHRRQTAA